MMFFLFSLFCSTLATLLIVGSRRFHSHLTADHDLNGVQKSHCIPVPRVGGAGIFVALSASSIWLSISERTHSDFHLLLLAPSLLVFGIGFIEDLTKRVSVQARLIVTMLAALVGSFLLDATVHSFGISVIDDIFRLPLVALVFTMIAVGGVANSINLIDGFNGLAGFISVMALSALGIVAYKVGDHNVFMAAMTGAGAIVGFLIWNYPRAQIFLGDGGAYLVGFLIAELSVLLHERNPQVSVLFPLLVVMYPVFETLFTIYRRKFVRGLSPGHPDALHLHQLINRRIVRWQVKHAAGTLRSRGNAMTSPYLWALNLLAIIPAVMFWDSPAILSVFIVFFAVVYTSFYKSLVGFKVPRPFKGTNTAASSLVENKVLPRVEAE